MQTLRWDKMSRSLCLQKERSVRLNAVACFLKKTNKNPDFLHLQNFVLKVSLLVLKVSVWA